MTTEKEQPAVEETGLDVDLGKAFDEVTKAETPEEAPAEPTKEEKPPETEEPEAEQAPPETEVQEETPEEIIEPPATWTAESKEKFGGLDPAIQQEVLKREKDFATGIQKNAEAAKLADSYEQVIAPYKAMIAAEGSNPVQAVQTLLNTAYQLRSATPEQKNQLFLGLAQQYGVDLSQLSLSDETDEYADPEMKALKDEVASLKQTTQSQMQAAQNQQMQTLTQHIEAFKNETNTDGSLKHEHYDKVHIPMSALLSNGGAQTLEEAYEQSLYLVPEVRDSLIQKQVKEAEQTRIKKETEAAAKAKKAAGTQLSNESAEVVVNAKDGTMQDDLGAAYDAAEAKTS